MMNILTKFLVETLLGEEISDKIVVYSGRFQPFHKGHFATYQSLVKKFGKDNVYIGTSNKTDNQKSPFGFKEKKYIINKMFGIPTNKIIQIKNPYAPVEILDKFDSKTTAFITAVGEKDEMRLSGKYFEKYKDNIDFKGYMDKGYVYISPSQPNAISGTDVRNWLGKGSEEDRKKGFMKAYPKFDEKIFKLITLTLNKITKESLVETSLGGYAADEGEPAPMYIPDGQKRILNKQKPEPWFKQLGYTQMDKPKADNMRGKGKSKDTDSQFRKVYYKVSNINVSDLKPVEKPKGVAGWKKIKEDVIAGGLSKEKSLSEFATKYNVSVDEIKNKIKEGAKVELEHTTDKRIAVEIAKDHIWEDLNYYAKLSKIEIVEITAWDAFPHDGNTTTGYIWNSDWDDYDNQDYYLYGLEGWNLYDSEPSKNFRNMFKGVTLPIDNHSNENGNYIGDEHSYITPEEFFGLDEAYTKGQLFAGKIKIGGHPVDVEVELVGADNKINAFLTKVIHIDSKYFKQVPIGSMLPVPARIFRTPGGGWRKIKTPSAFEAIRTTNHIPDDKDGAENDFNHHHKTSTYTPDYGHPAELDTIDFDDKRKKQPGHQTNTKDGEVRGYEPVKESLNEVKWEESTYEKCMLGKIPLSLQIVKQLVDPIKTTSMHVTDVENLPKVAALQGKQKSISTFNKISKYGPIAQGKGLHTKGGIIVVLSGTVLAQSIMDLWTEPDKRGLRWVNPGTVIADLGRETDVVFNFAPELKPYKEEWKKNMYAKPATNQEKYEFIQKYIAAAYKYMLSKKKQFQDKYLNSNHLYYDSEWNEVVLNQIKIEKILAIPAHWDTSTIEENETILKQLKQTYKNVEVAKTISDVQTFIRNNGGMIRESVNESLLMEGGAYGHMNHPFDIQMNLTFGDLKRIVKQALSGKLELAREKTDGQALAVSWVNGRLVAARNKSHLKNKGKDAMGVQDVISKFAGRGSVSDAFSFAIKDLESAIKGLSETSKKKIFKDGKCFMNCEIIYPENTNVIPYGQSLLVFHGTMEYNDEGNAIGENPESGAQLAAMVKKVNADVQSKFTIQGPPVQKLPNNKDLKAKQPIFLSKIQALQSEFGLSDKSGVADYHQAWWLDFINKNTKGLDEQQKIGLVKRWAFGDKGFRIKDIKDDKNRVWAEKIEKQDQQKITKDNLLKFETIFLGVGAEVLSFMTSVLTVNPEAAKQQMVGRLETAINSIKATGDAKNLDKLNIELARIEALGGFDKIVPNEGIVFNYKGNTFKLTGAFAPLNQILGIFTFSR